MNTPLNRNNDLEAEASPLLYPTMTESPELRWGFIRKVYAILTVQLLVTIAVAATVYIFRPISSFFARTVLGLSLYFTIIVTSLVVLIAMLVLGKKQPLNHFHLGLFTICLSLMVGVSCAFTSGKVIVEAAILTAVIFLSLSLYTFWAARRGHDFSFLEPFLFAGLTGLLVFGLIEFFYPVDNVTNGVVGIITFCGYVVYETENLIKRYKHMSTFLRQSSCIWISSTCFSNWSDGKDAYWPKLRRCSISFDIGVKCHSQHLKLSHCIDTGD